MSSRLTELDRQSVWHPFTPLDGRHEPVVITKANGIYLETEDGRKIVDGISSWWVTLHGHSNPVIAEAVYRQAKTLEHVIFAGFTHQPAIDLSSRLLALLPKTQSKIFFSDNGSTAVEVAIKMAIQYWKNKGERKRRIVAIDGAYHGDTFGAMSVGERGLFTEAFSSFLFDVDFIPWPDGTNDEHVVAALRTLTASGDVAAFIYEPLIQGAAGMRMYAPSLLEQLLSIAKKANVICIADEVFTGFGRTGRMFASEFMESHPDIMAISKGLTGGTMAMGITTCAEFIYDAFKGEEPSKVFYHGHSYTANPVACAAAIASHDLLVATGCRQRIKSISESQAEFVNQIRKYAAVANARSLGTVLAIELRSKSASHYNNKLREEIYAYFLSRDILLRPLGNVIYFLPSYVFSHEELANVYTTIETFIADRSKRNV